MFKNMDAWELLWWTLCAFGVALAFVLLAWAGTAVYMSSRSDGKIDYCTIMTDSGGDRIPSYTLYGHRNWHADVKLGLFKDPLEAVAMAERIGCSIVERKDGR